MATSGTADFSLNAREVITFALQKLNVYTPEESPSSQDMASGQRELNLMLKGWSRKGPELWTRAQGTVTLTPNTINYTLTPRPRRVISARYRNASGRDLPMELWTQDEYDEMPVKTSTGIPTSYYVDYQRDSVVMYIWQALAAVTTETIRYTYLRRIEDISGLENDLDIPQEQLDLVGYNLAVRLGPEHGKVGTDGYKMIAGLAAEMLADALADEREGVVRFVPDRR